ncbi:MAG: transglutaminase-like domain-containing protein [Emcibacter sp.]|nr:transglutaminase-like domain-containing protein [Emcibacter sp.]
MIDTNEKDIRQLKAVGTGDGSIKNIAYVALILASLDRPGVSFQKYEHHLEILALDLFAENHGLNSAKERAGALSTVLFERHDYTGNVDYYDDLQNANLMSVIDNRKGFPITLGILYMHAARSQGWHVEGLNFPKHFLIRLYGKSSQSDGQVIIDPFNEGKILEAQDLRNILKNSDDEGDALIPKYYDVLSDRDVLVRLLNNIKIRCLKVSDLGQTINILERLVVIDPKQMIHHYELGMLLAYVKKNAMAKKLLTYCMSNIDKFEPNDLIEQQMINALADIEKQEQENQKSNVYKLPDVE